VSTRTDGAAVRGRRHRTGRDRAVPADHPDGDRFADAGSGTDRDRLADGGPGTDRDRLADSRATPVADPDAGTDRVDRPRRPRGPRLATRPTLRAR
jgi:hypothetical protein